MTLIAGFDVDIRRQSRKSLALRATPGGLVALIPHALDADSDQVRQFIERGLARLSEPAPLPAKPIAADELRARVDRWADRLGVHVARVQIRQMRNKWASCSSKGTITLNADMLALPDDLVDYILVHELLHLKFAGHGKGWQAMMGVYVAGWQRKELQLSEFARARLQHRQLGGNNA